MDEVAWVISTGEANMAEQNGGGSEGESAPKKLSKWEAVERSLADLGGDAKPKAVQEDVKRRFGMDVSTTHIASVKAEFNGKAGEGKQPSAKKPAKPVAPKPADGRDLLHI